jgi:hypothetical protein
MLLIKKNLPILTSELQKTHGKYYTQTYLHGALASSLVKEIPNLPLKKGLKTIADYSLPSGSIAMLEIMIQKEVANEKLKFDLATVELKKENKRITLSHLSAEEQTLEGKSQIRKRMERMFLIKTMQQTFYNQLLVLQECQVLINAQYLFSPEGINVRSRKYLIAFYNYQGTD